MTKVATPTYLRMKTVVERKLPEELKSGRRTPRINNPEESGVRIDNNGQLQHRHSQQDWHNVEILQG